MIIINKDFINSIPKTITEGGCWIPHQIPYDDGYVHIKINCIRYSLHRLSMCIFYEIDYYNLKIDTRHSEICSRACFNPEHLKPGTTQENALNTVRHGKHVNASKENCPKCGNFYRKYRIKSGPRKGQYFRQCTDCKNKKRRNRYHGNS